MALIGIDTESHGGVPYSIQVSIVPGTALMVLVENAPLVEALVLLLNSKLDMGDELVLHNAPADLRILELVGVHCAGQYRDTMIEAYNFGNLPQGLKALAYRLLGHKRRSWDEVVTPPSRKVLMTWLENAIIWAKINVEFEDRVSAKTGRKLASKVIKHESEGVFKSILKHCESETYDPWCKIGERAGEWLSEVGEVIGPPPIKGIGHCRLEDQVMYACADADDTLRLALVFEEMRKNMVDVDEDDWDDVVPIEVREVVKPTPKSNWDPRDRTQMEIDVHEGLMKIKAMRESK